MRKAGVFLICVLLMGTFGGYVSPCQAAEPKIDLRVLPAKKARSQALLDR
jgi:hypothetical protein